MPRRLPKYCVEDRDRYDNIRVYLRRKGQPKVRLEGTPWTTEFMDAYHAALAGKAPAKTKAGTAGEGTWKWLCQLYVGSATFRQLEPVTQARRRPLLEATFDEPTKPGATLTFGEVPVGQMSAAAVRVLRDRKASHPHGANNTLKAVRAVFKWATSKEVELAPHNPARDVPLLAGKGGNGFHTWTDEEVLTFLARHPVGTRAHLAMMLLLFGGGRRSDVVGLGHRNLRDGWLHYTAHKNRNRKPIQVEIPVHAALADVILACPAHKPTFLMTEQGRSFTSNGFGNWFKDRCREAGLPHCSAHGLRKASATIAAEQGATTNQLMALFGWLTAKMAEHYTRAANRRKLAKAGSNFLSLPAPSLDKIENNEGISTPYESVGAQERTRTSTACTTGT